MNREPADGGDSSSMALLFGIGHEEEPPTWERVREQSWNPRDRRVFAPRTFGWGFDLNLHELFARLGFIERP